jgi:hypothetical protein
MAKNRRINKQEGSNMIAETDVINDDVVVEDVKETETIINKEPEITIEDAIEIAKEQGYEEVNVDTLIDESIVDNDTIITEETTLEPEISDEEEEEPDTTPEETEELTVDNNLKAFLELFNTDVNAVKLITTILASKPTGDIKIFFASIEAFLYSKQKDRTAIFFKELINVMKKNINNKENFNFFILVLSKLFTKYSKTEFNILIMTKGIGDLKGNQASEILAMITVFSKVSKKTLINDTKVVDIDKAFKPIANLTPELSKALKDYYTV